MKKLRVGVLFGGRSGEHEVSLASAASIIRGLDPDKYEPVPIGISKEGHWLIGAGAQKLLPEVLRQGQRVMMTGEMWAPQNATDGNLGYFQLVYSRSKCCFNGPPLAQHFVDGNVIPGTTVGYWDSPVRVWGTIHISPRRDKGSTKILSIYHVDVDKVEPVQG